MEVAYFYISRGAFRQERKNHLISFILVLVASIMVYINICKLYLSVEDYRVEMKMFYLIQRKCLKEWKTYTYRRMKLKWTLNKIYAKWFNMGIQSRGELSFKAHNIYFYQLPFLFICTLSHHDESYIVANQMLLFYCIYILT